MQAGTIQTDSMQAGIFQTDSLQAGIYGINRNYQTSSGRAGSSSLPDALRRSGEKSDLRMI